MDQFWHFLEKFEEWGRGKKKGKFHPEDNNPETWLYDPKLKR